MLRSPTAKLLALASSILFSAAANGTVVYTQSYDGSGPVLASQNDTSGGLGSFATAYDNFILGSSSNLTQVSFTGGYWNYFNQPIPGTITSFVLQIYGDNAGQPGSSLYTTTVGGSGGESCNAFAICTYSFAIAFMAAASTEYWMSIVPNLGFPPQWGWASGTGGDGASYQRFWTRRSAVDSDRAFSLDAAPPAVPEPATWATILTGFFIVGASLRRQRALFLLA